MSVLLPNNRNGWGLQLTEPTYRNMVGHCLQGKPLEACGLLSGFDGVAQRCWPIANTDNSSVSFTMDRKQLTSALEEIEYRGEQMQAIFHSHPASGAYPSKFDIEHAVYSCSYIIVSLLRIRPRIRSYRIEGSCVHPEPIWLLSRETGHD